MKRVLTSQSGCFGEAKDTMTRRPLLSDFYASLTRDSFCGKLIFARISREVALT
jgi:hypothetical protein